MRKRAAANLLFAAFKSDNKVRETVFWQSLPSSNIVHFSLHKVQILNICMSLQDALFNLQYRNKPHIFNINIQ